MFVSGSNNVSTDNRWDDCIIWNTAGSVNNDFFGDTLIETLMPTADTAQADLTPLGGGTNFSEVDDPTQDGDTTYNSSSTGGHQDRYAAEDIAGTAGTIRAVQPVTYAKKTDSGSASIKTVIKEGTTTTVGAGQNLLTSYAYYDDIHETNPDTSNAWTQTEVDAAEVGVQVG